MADDEFRELSDQTLAPAQDAADAGASCRASVLTPPGRGAVATIVVEGPDATRLVGRLFQSVARRSLDQFPIGRIVFGHWLAVMIDAPEPMRRTHGRPQALASRPSRTARSGRAAVRAARNGPWPGMRADRCRGAN